jgi:hypothetical protein
MLTVDNIMNGEKFQMETKMYLGTATSDFTWNPNIGINPKNVIICSINGPFDNPDSVFCYGHALEELSYKIDLFMNDFTLVSGNSDQNIYPTAAFLKIVNHPRVKVWYAQNPAFEHPKLKILPIGIANSHWEHGNVNLLLTVANKLPEKKNGVYFNFRVHTNFQKRSECFEALKDRLPFLDMVSVPDNVWRLGTYKFCICPEGNGLDSHRIWECYYLRVVPIVVENEFIKILKSQWDIPMVILKDWKDLKLDELNYDQYKDKFTYKPATLGL